MKPYYERGGITIYHGDCRDILPQLEPVEAIVTDPPYGLEFMGKEWDHGIPETPFWLEALRVLKPGGHAVIFGGSRTHHRLWCAVEDAGFEVRDCLMWLYGAGFPKSLDVSKAIDKAAGAEREVVGQRPAHTASAAWRRTEGREDRLSPVPYTAPTTDDIHAKNPHTKGGFGHAGASVDAAREWQGWGTALKPAWEPILLARKPLTGTVAANVQKHGTGAINVGATRIGIDSAYGGSGGAPVYKPSGRWPANLVLECTCEETREGRVKNRGYRRNGSNQGGAFFGNTPDSKVGPRGYKDRLRIHTDPNCPCALLDAQSGERVSNDPGMTHTTRPGWGMSAERRNAGYSGDSGGASRFFYCAKASRSERGKDNNHPTVKPLALMQWLCRLITPPNGLILDPFMGTATTLLAAQSLGFRAIGIEIDEKYCEIAVKRLAQEVLLL